MPIEYPEVQNLTEQGKDKYGRYRFPQSLASVFKEERFESSTAAEKVVTLKNWKVRHNKAVLSHSKDLDRGQLFMSDKAIKSADEFIAYYDDVANTTATSQIINKRYPGKNLADLITAGSDNLFNNFTDKELSILQHEAARGNLKEIWNLTGDSKTAENRNQRRQLGQNIATALRNEQSLRLAGTNPMGTTDLIALKKQIDQAKNDESVPIDERKSRVAELTTLYNKQEKLHRPARIISAGRENGYNYDLPTDAKGRLKVLHVDKLGSIVTKESYQEDKRLWEAEQSTRDEFMGESEKPFDPSKHYKQVVDVRGLDSKVLSVIIGALERGDHPDYISEGKAFQANLAKDLKEARARFAQQSLYGVPVYEERDTSDGDQDSGSKQKIKEIRDETPGEQASRFMSGFNAGQNARAVGTNVIASPSSRLNPR